MKKQLLAALILSALSARGSQSDYIAKTKRLDNYRVIVSCENGADPTGVTLGYNVIMITCVYEGRSK